MKILPNKTIKFPQLLDILFCKGSPLISLVESLRSTRESSTASASIEKEINALERRPWFDSLCSVWEYSTTTASFEKRNQSRPLVYVTQKSVKHATNDLLPNNLFMEILTFFYILWEKIMKRLTQGQWRQRRTVLNTRKTWSTSKEYSQHSTILQKKDNNMIKTPRCIRSMNNNCLLFRVWKRTWHCMF